MKICNVCGKHGNLIHGKYPKILIVDQLGIMLKIPIYNVAYVRICRECRMKLGLMREQRMKSKVIVTKREKNGKAIN